MLAQEPVLPNPSDDEAGLPVIIVGSGPVGLRVARELRHRMPGLPLLLFGDEPHEPYSREQLSSWLAGQLTRNDLLQPLSDLRLGAVEQRLGYRIVALDRLARTVTDSSGASWRYRALVIATGTRPHVPNIAGVQLPGVFRFHDLNDATRLLARRARSHHTIVLGAGPLGIEVAQGMRRMGTRVTVLDHADRLLPMHLDEHASAFLQYEMCRRDIAVLPSCGVTRVCGDERVEGVCLRDGTELACDTLILATGVRPAIDFARVARLAHRDGILVDDRMQTSDPSIFAVGDCAEHRERCYGRVDPGLEQAVVAAANICGEEQRYCGSNPAYRLKVLGMPVFSVGPMGINERRHYGHSYRFCDPAQDRYRRILVHRHRLVGAIGVGEWDEAERVEALVRRRGWIKPWQVWRFQRGGRLGV